MALNLDNLLDILNKSVEIPALKIWLSLETGEIFHFYDDFIIAIGLVPGDIGEKEKWLRVPSATGIGCSKELNLQFIIEFAPSFKKEAEIFLNQVNWPRNFRNFCNRHNLNAQWLEYSDAAMRQCLRKWLEENNIKYFEPDRNEYR
ncbi:hypothetical protein KKF34_04405 [Myxococcota bacterium]|nr:hypothetical protein [Myxococcota bacterium]MBU1496100.1 hypothetical protein [Myxococcota bacterium]